MMKNIETDDDFIIQKFTTIININTDQKSINILKNLAKELYSDLIINKPNYVFKYNNKYYKDDVIEDNNG
jgi:hypothetical protein